MTPAGSSEVLREIIRQMDIFRERLESLLPPSDELVLTSPDSVSDKTVSDREREKWFNSFWDIVWAKIGVADAKKAFMVKARTRDEAVLIYKAAKAQRELLLARAAESDNRPIHPATWLRQERYRDEILPTGRRPSVVVAAAPELQSDEEQRILAEADEKWRKRLADPKTDAETRAWIIEQFPHLKEGA